MDFITDFIVGGYTTLSNYFLYKMGVELSRHTTSKECIEDKTTETATFYRCKKCNVFRCDYCVKLTDEGVVCKKC